MSEVIDFARFKKKAAPVETPVDAASSDEGQNENVTDPWGIYNLSEQSAERLLETILTMKAELFRDSFQAIKDRGFQSGTPIHLVIDTRVDGVIIPQWLKARYPDGMGLVLENVGHVEAVSDTSVELALSFNGVMTHIIIPYRAIVKLLIESHDFGIMGF